MSKEISLKVIILAFAMALSACSTIAVTKRSQGPCTRSYAAPITDATAAAASAVGTGVMAHRAETATEKKLVVMLAVSYLLFGYSAYHGVNSVDECRYK